MKTIKLTSKINGAILYINPDMIGHFYRIEKVDTSFPESHEKRIKKYTRVGSVCHNNGGFKVTETPEQIISIIKNQIK